LIFIALLVIGVPIGFSLLLASITFIVFSGDLNLMTMAAQRVYIGTSSFPLLAIPFFILAGLLMNTGGVSRRLFKFATCLVGHITGGLGHVNVLASMLFAGMSGSAVADAAGLGVIEIEAMRKEGFDDSFSAAITAASSTIGPIIPPSIPMVIFGGLTSVSVARLFLGGFIPGVLMGFSLMVVVYLIAKRRNYPVHKRAPFKERWFAFLDAIPALLLPAIIMGGILGGIFTPTEAAVVASIYAFILGTFFYKELKMKDLLEIIKNTMRSTAQVLLIIGSAALFGWLLAYQKVPDMIIRFAFDLTSNKYVILLLINIICLILGCFLEAMSILVLTIPVVLPLAKVYGIDLVHLGVLMTLNLMVGTVTPPVGVCLYPVMRIANVSMMQVLQEIWVYIVVLVAVLLLITYCPTLVTFLPNLIMG